MSISSVGSWWLKFIPNASIGTILSYIAWCLRLVAGVQIQLQ